MNLQNFTKLQVTEVQRPDQVHPSIIVKTPMGKREVKLKNTHHKLFGSVTQTDRYNSEIIDELQLLEIESKEFLFAEWLKQ